MLNGDNPVPLVVNVPRVVVCIPAFNEEKTIGRVIQSAQVFADYVLVCDDGSTDHTSTEVLRNGAVLVRHDKNQGKGVALRTLLHEASKFEPDVLVTLDADGQHDPADVPSLATPILDGSADVVVGSRFSGVNVIPFYRRLGNSLLSVLTNWTARTRVRDTQSGFRAYSSRVISNISIMEEGMGVDSEILIKAARGGFRIAERAVSVTYAGDTSTFNPVSHMFRVLWALVRSQHHMHPRIPRLAGMALLSFSTLLLVYLGISITPIPSLGLATSVLGMSMGGIMLALSHRQLGHRGSRVMRS